jgi:hypothetical protein
MVDEKHLLDHFGGGCSMSGRDVKIWCLVLGKVMCGEAGS